MKRIFIVITILVLTLAAAIALGVDHSQTALAQAPQPPDVDNRGGGGGGTTTPQWYNNLPDGEYLDSEIQAWPYRQMSYQGKLEIDGSPCSGSINITFRLYSVSSGGAAMWTETQPVTCDNGLFSVMLGAVTPLPYAVSYQSQLWLGVQPAGSAAELTPRQMLGTVGYAMNLMPGATMVDANPAGTYGYSLWVSSDEHRGIYGSSAYTDGVGLTGIADGPRGASTYGPVGVYGYSDVGYGVYGESGYTGVNGVGYVGVWGHAAGEYDYGVWGDGGTLTGTVATGGGVYGPYSLAIYGYATGDSSYGVYAYATGDYSYGVYSRAYGVSSPGVYGYSEGFDSPAVIGVTYSDNDTCYVGDYYCASGVLANSWGDAYGSFAYGDMRSGVIGISNDTNYFAGAFYNYNGNDDPGLYVGGETYLAGYLTVGAGKSGYVVDIALNAGSEPLERGDVVVVVGMDAPVVGEIPVMRVQKATPETASGIVGVVDVLYEACDRPAEEMQAGEGCGGYNPDVTTIQPGQHLGVVTLGAFQWLKVDASTPIKAGDLLSISPTAGVAAKAQQITIEGYSFYAPGTIIGKALQDLDSGTGYIAVFVSLK